MSFRNPLNNPNTRLFVSYLGLVNTTAAGLFGLDKEQARTGGWRIPEKVLCSTALVGGWLGGFVAMRKFHHKTKKQSFLQKYYACVAANIGLMGLLAAPTKLRNHLMQRFLRR
ncbi:hypothetical protein Gasu2_43890 [Galdieria sulphuraria]|uniref:DUF1294 domain-containing protein n=1 Tax=Galdieria sulphuraria TaxID=130081 RepID=M2VWY7_GALSU|nr:uncharacterized protein Gasu_47520 [Galdieria sulphuraria]EME27766.1 hypothetical protein Gasu_47520 [Galdieria sulphuraria]GJD10181.1 hypothetical protein Gasu2_43890 [Galdieria sulphuraria]|eukprot:XP_005704286.1 hypothetical protein Gasu_47520 [Galdieria sulphuraria]